MSEPLFKIIIVVVVGIIIALLIGLIMSSLDVKRKEQERLLREQAARHEAERRQRAEQQAALKREQEAKERQRREEEQRQEEERERRGIFILCLRPGLEAFTPKPLPKGRPYRITVEGIYQYRHWGWHKADPCYYAPEVNFIKRYRKLLFDAQCINPCEEDRHIHSYCFPYTGTGRKLSLLLTPPEKDSAETQGTLAVVIAPPSPEELAARDQAQREAEERQRAEQQAATKTDEAARRREEELRRHQEEEKRRKQEEERRADLQEMVSNLKLRAHVERIYLLPEYRQNFAKYKTAEVLAGKQKFADEYRDIMGNQELVSALKEDAPEVLEWLNARHDLILLAEQLSVAPPPPPPPKRRPTEVEIRAKKARLVQRAARDKMAEKAMILDAVREFDQQLTQYDLDDDERERLVSEFAGELLADEKGEGKKLD